MLINVKHDHFFYFYLTVGSSRFVGSLVSTKIVAGFCFFKVKDSFFSWLTKSLVNRPADPLEEDWCHIGLSVSLIVT